MTKIRINVTIDELVMRKARSLELNVSQILESALRARFEMFDSGEKCVFCHQLIRGDVKRFGTNLVCRACFLSKPSSDLLRLTDG